MFTRIVTMTCKPGQVKQACKHLNDNVLPILKKQKGFLDEIVLVSTTDPNQVLGMSFWNSREDAEAWHREQFPRVRQQIMQDVLASEPVLQTYDVDISTAHRITAGKAA
jgi:heme-degrading monooxygenase HmoA